MGQLGHRIIRYTHVMGYPSYTKYKSTWDNWDIGWDIPGYTKYKGTWDNWDIGF